MPKPLFSLIRLGLVASALAMLVASCMHAPPVDGGFWTVSWYGKPFHGRATASGEVYNMYALTAAHKTLPFGTRLRLTNPVNGRSTTVVINDRGPFVAGRDLDISYAAARQLDMVRDGVARLRVDIVGRNPSYPVEYGSVSHAFALQSASFVDAAAAHRVREQVARAIPSTPTRVVEASDAGKTLFRVITGPFSTRSAAEAQIPALKALGLSPLVREYF